MEEDSYPDLLVEMLEAATHQVNVLYCTYISKISPFERLAEVPIFAKDF